ncbi:hypothetical protein [Streptomyces luteolus]|uniref:Integral membrane protein n=1 Tax=Streptomyces luteolus TaxID=3043615 RepID=A0ABT6SN20_9ACTN|nr:hypothetical protein [Streptomyces sp. B-S-A12]MDI3416988.1 hypothetical protein [Streptomyces sp. B-S-A12]
MIWETLGSVLLGLALAWAADHRLAHRLPARNLVFATGVASALLGAFITHSALGSGYVLATLFGAATLATALLSLLLRPQPRRTARPTSAA